MCLDYGRLGEKGAWLGFRGINYLNNLNRAWDKGCYASGLGFRDLALMIQAATPARNRRQDSSGSFDPFCVRDSTTRLLLGVDGGFDPTLKP